MAWRAHRQNVNLLIIFIFVFVFLYLIRSKPPSEYATGPPLARPASEPTGPKLALGDDDVEMVVASLKRENITWLDDYLLNWKKNIYVVDDPTAELTVPTNKGREAMVFLTYVT